MPKLTPIAFVLLIVFLISYAIVLEGAVDILGEYFYWYGV